METIINIPNQCLWPNSKANGKLKCFDVLPTISLQGKVYDSAGGKIMQRSIAEHTRIGINMDASKSLQWLYAPECKNIIVNQLHKSSPNGLATLSNAELDQVAGIIAQMSHDIIISDCEPHDPVADGWIWDSWTQPQRISYLSQKVKMLTQNGPDGIYKKYMDWFQSMNFKFNGKKLGLLTGNGVWQSSSGTSVDDYIAYYANSGAATDFDDFSSMGRVGWGYTSITDKVDNAGGNPSPAHQSWGTIPSYLSSLCGINRGLAKDPNRDIMYVIWPREDQERLNNRSRRFKPTKLDGSVQPTGFLRMTDSRLTYPAPLIRDNVTVAMCNPRVVRFHAWIMPNSEDPFDIMRYARRNGQVACADNNNGASLLGFELANYTGNDAGSLPCPSGNVDYIGDEAIGYNAIMQGLSRAAEHQDILDGTQVRSSLAFQYKRSWENSFTSVAAVNGLAEFAKAWKDKMPWNQLWTNPRTGKALLLYQDCFEEAFQPHELKINIKGTERQFTVGNQKPVNGNELFMVRFD